jgi:integrase
MGAGWTDHGLVFCHPTGGPLHPERFSRTFADRSRQIGLPAIRLHDLRHTWATLALAAGVHPKVVQERLGHANISITLDIYSHVTEGLHSDAAAKVANVIFGRG